LFLEGGDSKNVVKENTCMTRKKIKIERIEG